MYSFNFDEPFTTFKLSIATEATTAFFLLQIEQLHLRRFSSPFGKISSAPLDARSNAKAGTKRILYRIQGNNDGGVKRTNPFL